MLDRNDPLVRKTLTALHDASESQKRLKAIDEAARKWAEWRLGQCDAPKGINLEEVVLLVAALGIEDPRLAWLKVDAPEG